MYQPNVLTVSEREIWAAVKLIGESCLSEIRSAVETATGLSGADFEVLSRLRASRKGDLNQHELQTSLDWAKSRLSHHITRMEARQLLKRRSKTGRNVLLTLLPEGRRCIESAIPVHTNAVRQILQHISAEEGKLIVHLALDLQGALAAFQQAQSKTRSTSPLPSPP